MRSVLVINNKPPTLHAVKLQSSSIIIFPGSWGWTGLICGFLFWASHVVGCLWQVVAGGESMPGRLPHLPGWVGGFPTGQDVSGGCHGLSPQPGLSHAWQLHGEKGGPEKVRLRCIVFSDLAWGASEHHFCWTVFTGCESLRPGRGVCVPVSSWLGVWGVLKNLQRVSRKPRMRP